MKPSTCSVPSARAWCLSPAHLLMATAALGIGLAALLPSPVLGTVQAQTPASAGDATPPEVDKNGKICQIEDVTGSRMKKRICYTPERWEARQRAARETVREMDAKPVTKAGEG